MDDQVVRGDAEAEPVAEAGDRLAELGILVAAGAAASGSRVWIVARAGEWLTPARRRAVTALLIAAGVLGAGAIGPTP